MTVSSNFLLLTALLPVLVAQTNLLENPDFESEGNWICTSCSGAQYADDAKSGSHSYKVSDRTQVWSSFSQTIEVSSAGFYYFKVWVKILGPESDTYYHKVVSMVDKTKTDGTHKYEQAGNSDFVYADRWYLVGGDKYISGDTVRMRFYLKIDDISVEYLVDDASVDKIAYLKDFETEADERIDQLRKAEITISMNGDSDPANLQVEIEQIKSEFGWGSAVDAKMIVDPNYQAYKDFFYDLFEWGVLSNALKWKPIEKKQDEFNYDTPRIAIEAMKSRGIKMRGHTMVWGVDKHVPDWQKTMSNTELRDKLLEHVEEMTRNFGGNFSHWDVYNENIHGRFYENKLEDKLVAQWLMKEVKRLDPQSASYLNDYNVVVNSYSTMAYVDQAYWYRESGVPLNGLGIQSHFGDFLSLSCVKRRLDEVAAVGLPIWITELDISEPDDELKAQKYEDLMRLYFSHPSVKGVMMWNYWDQRHWRPMAAIATGDEVTPNEAGMRVIELLSSTWRTNESHGIDVGQTVNIRAFKGLYQLNVIHNGEVIRSRNFYLTDGGTNLDITLAGTDSNPRVSKVEVERL